MRRTKLFASIAASAAIVISLAACGGGDKAAATGDGANAAPLAVPTVATTTAPQQFAPTTAPTTGNPLGQVGEAVQSNNVAGQYDVVATQQYLVAMIQHQDTIWSNWFKSQGLPEPWVGYKIIMPGEQFTTECLPGKVLTSTHPNAYYCPNDLNQSDKGMLYLPVETFAHMWEGNIFERRVDTSQLKRVGDFAAASVLAHEFGHSIQAELGEDYAKADPANPDIELIADCFSGIWAYSMSLDQKLEEGDIDEALNALEVIGDNTGSHGTGPQRNDAYRTGLYGIAGNEANTRGVPWTCAQKYWPGLYQS